MTPTVSTDNGFAALVPGYIGSPDEAAVMVLDLDGDVLFHGLEADAQEYMAAQGLRPHCNCELVEETEHAIGFEAH